MSLYGQLQIFKSRLPKASYAQRKINRVFLYLEKQGSWNTGDLVAWYRDGEAFFAWLIHGDDYGNSFGVKKK